MNSFRKRWDWNTLNKKDLFYDTLTNTKANDFELKKHKGKKDNF